MYHVQYCLYDDDSLVECYNTELVAVQAQVKLAQKRRNSANMQAFRDFLHTEAAQLVSYDLKREFHNTHNSAIISNIINMAEKMLKECAELPNN